MIAWLQSILIFLGIALGTITCSILIFYLLGFIVYVTVNIINWIEVRWNIDGSYCVLGVIISVIAIVIIHDVLINAGG